MDSELLTDDELEAMRLSAQLANIIAKIVGKGSTRQGDMQEFVADIHHIQHRIMAQAAARAYPDKFRLLGHQVGL